MKNNARHSSLSTKICLSFVIVSIFIFSVSMFSSYSLLKYYIYQNSANFLNNEINIIESIIKKHPNNLSALKQEIIWEPGLSDSNYMARLLNEKGKIFLETPGMAKIIPNDVTEKERENILSERPLQDEQLDKGKQYYRVMSKYIILPGSSATPKVLIAQVSMNVTREHHLLQVYKSGLAIIFLFGLFVSALVSYFIPYWFLKPFRKFIDQITNQSIGNIDKEVNILPTSKEMQRLLHEFNRMLSRIRHEYNKVQQFSSDVAHELRTPINNILLIAEDASTVYGRDVQVGATFQSMMDEFRRVSQIIDRLLFLTKADAMKLDIKKTTFSAQEEIKKLVEYFSLLADSKEVSLEIQGDVKILADKTLFSQAVSNLLSNAIKHSPENSQIKISLSRENGFSIIAVKDEGEGIPEEALPYIFDRFFQVDQSRNKKIGGYGLGLSIVKSIMDIHDGGVKVTSYSPGGSVFSLMFPDAK